MKTHSSPFVIAVSFSLLFGASHVRAEEETAEEKSEAAVVAAASHITEDQKANQQRQELINNCNEIATVSSGVIASYDHWRNSMFGLGVLAAVGGALFGAGTAAMPIMILPGTNEENLGYGITFAVFTAVTAALAATATGLFTASSLLFTLTDEEIAEANAFSEAAQNTAFRLAAGAALDTVKSCKGRNVRRKPSPAAVAAGGDLVNGAGTKALSNLEGRIKDQEEKQDAQAAVNLTLTGDLKVATSALKNVEAELKGAKKAAKEMESALKVLKKKGLIKDADSAAGSSAGGDKGPTQTIK